MTGSRPVGAGASGSIQAQSLAAEARAHVVAGRDDAARTTYEDLVIALQRRASRLAYFYLRDAADADEAVQDAFVKAFMNLRSYNDAMPFDAWFTRILVNGCLDRLKSRRRRWQWFSSLEAVRAREFRDPPTTSPSPEDMLIASEGRSTLGAAIDRLPERQRTVVLLTHLDGRTPSEISAITGLNESTVRVHLFRAIRRLRAWLAAPAADSRDSREAEG